MEIDNNFAKSFNLRGFSETQYSLFSKIIKHVKSKKKFNFNNFNLEITTTCKECN